MTGSRLRWFGAAAAIFLIAAPAFAQTVLPDTPADDPLDARDAKRVDRMEKVVRELRDIVFKAQRTGAPVVVQPADTDARMAEQAAKIDDLQQTLTRVNGSLDQAAHDADQARRDNLALQVQVKALADRVTALEQKPAAEAPGPPPPPEPPVEGPPKPAAQAAFTAAYKLLLSGDYPGAEAAFGAYVATYPDSPRTPEARYWLGKTLVTKGDEQKAATAFMESIRGFPQTAWAPNAMIELARSLVALKQPAQACATLAEIPKRYPKAAPSVAAKIASTRVQAKCVAP